MRATQNTGQDTGADGLSALARQVAAKTRAISERIHEHTVVTPLTPLAATGPAKATKATAEEHGAGILLKREHQQKTGSFKVRGALAKLLSLNDDQRERGVVAASTGNHGLGVAYALSVLGRKGPGGTGIVCVPGNASPVKVAAIRRYGVEVRVMGRHPAETETLARRLAAESGMSYISPYNDLDVIAGQGTVGEEIVRQLAGRAVTADAATKTTVVVAVGGGGLVSGIGAAIKSALPGIRIIGASPANDAAMAASVRAGRVVEVNATATISDGTAGGVEEGSITLPLCAELVDEWMLIGEPEIRDALRFMIDTEHQLIEGAAAMAVAAGLRAARAPANANANGNGNGNANDDPEGRTIVVVSCGANISSTVLAEAIAPAS